MDFKTYKKIESFLFSGKQLRLNQSIVDRLLSGISDIFIIAGVEHKVNEKEMIDENGFVRCGTDLPIPF